LIRIDVYSPSWLHKVIIDELECLVLIGRRPIINQYDKRYRYIGHSLSFCVKDILEGVMPIKCVKAIHSGTRIRTLHEWRHVVKQYIHTYWSGYEFKDVQFVLNKLLFGNKVFYQCRLDGKRKILKETWTKA